VETLVAVPPAQALAGVTEAIGVAGMTASVLSGNA